MHYELITTIRPEDPAFQKQKKRLQESGGKFLSISPGPDFQGILENQGLAGINIIDRLTKRSHDSADFLFFNQAPVPVRSAVFMNEDFSISILNEGEEIAQETLFPNTRRHARELTYVNQDGTKDYTEEFADDGRPYSRIYFHKDKAQEIDFLNDAGFPTVSYFFYEGMINEVLVRDPESREVIKHYDNTNEFIAAQVAAIVKPEDTVSISYMGLEMTALRDSKGQHTFHLGEAALDDNGNVKGNLQLMLEDKIPYIHEVKLPRLAFEQLAAKKVSMKKASIEY